jgi:phage FluMu protein Com
MSLSKEICFACKKEFEYGPDKYCDVFCPNCGVINSFYDPMLAVDKEVKSTIHPDCEECQKLFDGPIPVHYCSICSKKPTQPKEEEMIDYGQEKYQGRYVFMPLMGEEAEFEIVEIKEVKSENSKMNFKDKVPVMANGEQVVDDDGDPVFKEKDLGYHVEATLKNGKILSIGSLSQLQQVFKKNEIQDGNHIIVKHIDKGKWVVTKL